MRVLCTVTGKPSHARAMLPLARALADARHEVLVVVPPELTHVFTDEPVTVLGALPAPGASSRVGPQLADTYRALIPVARDFGPDLILRDGTEFAASLVGDELGVPHVPVPSGSGNVFDPALVLKPLNERRAELGLATTEDPAAIFRYGRLDCMPPELTFIANPTPHTFAYRQPATVTRDERLPEWLADLPADKPLAVAAIGTALPQFKDLNPAQFNIPAARWQKHNPVSVLDAMVAGLARVDCVAVVATGGVPVREESRSPHVHLVDSFAQPLLLQCAQLLLTHGGYNSIREAVGAGVPMAVLPVFGDQPKNAERAEELGLGARVEDVDAAQVAKACDRVLQDPGFTARARQAQRRMLALPGVAGAVKELERVAASGTPLRES
ncbi:glycosyltransferase [Streptomyces sp. MUM 178J]|uniref:glycosyltransferase n=1 Tax=Streptomyces sp. MUM 178J TaxID=2791991 RepID=UPI001F03887C|nr:glycosyltransferase [Streptomyces sp. MUM 178J]WRQ80783.1 glycosyltransferase [Streptomyces sp. MUM 178J]